MAEKMFETRLLVMLAETPVHAGSGAELGAVDLPLQRERHTRYPTIHGSGVKGVLRELCKRANGNGITEHLFGSEPPDSPGGGALEAGSLAVSDARLLLFPVRGAGSVPFVWTTCPYLLERLRRDLEQTGAAQGKKLVEAIAESTRGLGDEKGRTPKDFPLDRALIEELEVPVDKKGVDGLAAELGTQFFGTPGLEYWRSLLAKILVVLPDGVFADLVLHCTEIVTRVRLSENKTVEEGALWTEEYAPADTLFYSVLGLEGRRLAQKLKQHNSGAASPAEAGWKWVQDFVDRNPLAQFGGKETIGRGFFRLHLWPH